jgi:uncharacterized phage-like protein YoqJ
LQYNVKTNKSAGLEAVEMYVCAIASGDLKGRNIGEKEKGIPKKNLSEIIYRLYRSGVTDFYICAERDIPLWTAEIIIGMKMRRVDVKLHMVIPYDEECLEWRHEWRNTYYRAQEWADGVEFASMKYSDGCRNRAYEIMTDASDCICIFGEKPEDSCIVRYAKSDGIEVRHISSDILL